MFDWSLMVGAFTAGVGACFVLLRGAATIKSLLPSRASPKLLPEEKCFIFPTRGVGGRLSFNLLVDNSKGTKDCSLLKPIELRLLDGVITHFEYAPDLPATIPTGQTVRIKVAGDVHEAHIFKEENLHPTGHRIEAIVVAKFNIPQTIEKKITFIIIRP